MGGHGTIGGFIRVIGIIQAVSFFEGFELPDDTVSVLGVVFRNPCFNAGGVKEQHGRFVFINTLKSVRSGPQDDRTWIISPIGTPV